MLSIIAAKSDYIRKADQVYQNLNEFQKQFEAEAKITAYLKCALLAGKEPEDFYADGHYAQVSFRNGGYLIFYEGYRMEITVYDKQIIALAVYAGP